MYVDYQKVVAMLAEEVTYAKGLPITTEDPYGEMKEYFIKDISFHILRNNSLEFGFMNSFLEDVSPGCETSMLIRICIGNHNKESSLYFAYEDLPMNPEGLRIFIRGILHEMCSQAVVVFFGQKNKNSRFSVRAKNQPEIYLDKVRAFNGKIVSPAVLQQIACLSREVYKLPGVTASCITLTKQQFLNIVVDSDGRRVLEARPSLSLDSRTKYLNQQRYYFELNNSFFFLNEEQLVKNFPSLRQDISLAINQCRQIGFLDSGQYPILLSTASTHTLFHEALAAHLFSGDLIINDESTYFKNFHNRDLTDLSEDYEILKDLTISVDPTKQGVFGGYKYDQEGVKSQKIILCDRGKLSDYLLTLNSAARMKTLSNGCARAEHYCGAGLLSGEAVMVRPEARISHLVIESHNGLTDSQLQKTIEKSISNGRRKFDFYLEMDSKAGRVDPETGVFTLDVDFVKKIYFDGRPAETVYGGTISGTPPDLLAGIKAVGRRRGYDAGYCGSVSGWVPVSSQTPKMFLMANFVPNPRPEPEKEYNAERDKYIPEF